MRCKMSKKALCLCMVVVLAIGLAIPTFALIEPTGDFADWIFGWQGSGQTALLNGHGINNNFTVGTSNQGGNDVWYVDSSGGDYTIKSGDRAYCANIYRVLQSGTYYPCTGYYYENATGGRDQRVQLLQGGGHTVVRLASPVMGGNWYMVADYSQPTAVSDVIWYTDASAMKAWWG